MNNDSIYEMTYIDSDKLIILAEKYQRSLKNDRVQKIIANFDEHIANEPKVSCRDEQFFVFDGQHTVAAREIMNGGEPLPILCKVYYGLTEEDEALLFSMQTGISSKPTSGERLRARLFGMDAVSMAFRDATESCGFLLETGSSHGDCHIVCVDTAFREYKRSGDDMYREALGIIGDAWNGKSDSLKLEIIKGVMQFVRVYHGKYNRDRLVSRLQKTPPVDIKNKVITEVNLPVGKKYINPIYQIYNGNAKVYTLPMLF